MGVIVTHKKNQKTLTSFGLCGIINSFIFGSMKILYVMCASLILSQISHLVKQIRKLIEICKK